MDGLQRSIAFLAHGPTKEKCMRLGQYFCYLLHGIIGKSEILAEIAKKARNLGMNLALMRKIVRLGVPIELIYAIYRRFVEKKTEKSSLIRSLAQIFRVFYLLTDHALLCYRINLVKSHFGDWKLPLLDSFNNFMWLFEVILTLIANSYELNTLETELVTMQDKNYHQMQGKERDLYQNTLNRLKITQLDTIRGVGDLPLILFFMRKELFSGSFIGGMGVITSIIGCYQCWIHTNRS